MSGWPEADRELRESLLVLCENSVGLDDSASWPSASLGSLGESGVLGWVIPREYGGGGVEESQLVAGYLQLSRACLPTAFILTQRNAACQRFAGSENERLKADLLPRLTAADRFATVGISHLTTSRQHLDQPAVRVVLDGSHVRLDGMVPWVTGAGQADWVLTGGSCEDGTQVLVALPMDASGITVLPAPSLLALDSSQTASIRLDQVVLDSSMLVAGPTPSIMQGGIGGGGTGSLGTSALALGAASASLDRLSVEAANRPDLGEVLDPLVAERDDIVSDLLTAAGACVERDTVELTTESLRQRSNSLVLRSAAAYLGASKGAGFTASHPASRVVRESMFFLVWSCPQAVLAANLREFTVGAGRFGC